MIQIQNKRNQVFKCFSNSSAILQHWVLITALAPALTSCMGVYEGGFECPPGKGLGCTSISEVNEKVNQGLGSRNQNSNQEKDDLNESETPSSSCKGGSCAQPSPSSEIWYSPWFSNSRDSAPNKQRSDTKVFHVQDSI